MEHSEVLLLEFEGNEHLGQTVRRIIESCPDPGFKLAQHTCNGSSAVNTELYQIILKQKPLLILLVLPRLSTGFLDSVFQVLGPAALSPPVVVVTGADQEDLIELARARVADFIIPPLRDSEVLVRMQRLVNQASREEKTRQ